jgi:HD-like signal output (HDOD) protein
LTADAPKDIGNPLIVIGDKIERKPYLAALLQELRVENALLDPEQRIKYAVCADSTDVALALRKYLDSVKMVMLGPGLIGKPVTVARMLSKKAHIVMVIDPQLNPLGGDPISHQQIQRNLEDLGVIIVYIHKATQEFFEPLIQDYVLSGLSPSADLDTMTPEERAQMVDKRLDSVNKFPSLPETQRRVAELDDLAPPKKWAEAIDPDVPTRTVILKILNSARYGFRSRVESIDQAVALASARTIREIVTACAMRQLFHKTAEGTIEQFWRHSLAVAFYAKLFPLPADPKVQNPQQKIEFERFQFEDDQMAALKEVRLWEKFNLETKDEPFTSGLLHDIGKVTLLMCLEDSLPLIAALIDAEAAEAQQQKKLWAHSIREVERFLMKDMDHQVIGSRLADKWELEATLQQVIGHHHDIHEQSPDLLKLVALADLGANTLFPYPATAKQHPFPVLFERVEKAVKKKATRNLEDAVDEVIGQDIFEDLVDVLTRLDISEHLWEIVDFKTFFKLCYMVDPKIKSAAIAFLQQTA